MNAVKVDKLEMPIVKALSACTVKNESRRFAQVIHYDKEEGALVATCGKNMLVWTSIPQSMKQKLEEGRFYTLDGNYLVSVDEDITYPSWKRVVPSKEGAREIDVDMYSSGKKAKGAADILGTAASTGIRLNFQYLLPVGDLRFSKLYVRDKECAVLAEAQGLQFVIMPMVA